MRPNLLHRRRRCHVVVLTDISALNVRTKKVCAKKKGEGGESLFESIDTILETVNWPKFRG